MATPSAGRVRCCGAKGTAVGDEKVTEIRLVNPTAVWVVTRALLAVGPTGPHIPIGAFNAHFQHSPAGGVSVRQPECRAALCVRALMVSSDTARAPALAPSVRPIPETPIPETSHVALAHACSTSPTKTGHMKLLLLVAVLGCVGLPSAH